MKNCLILTIRKYKITMNQRNSITYVNQISEICEISGNKSINPTPLPTQ